MTLAFRASQHLDLPVASQSKHLRSYLRQEDRVIKALLDERQLERIGPGRYRYTVTTLQVPLIPVPAFVPLANPPKHHKIEVIDAPLSADEELTSRRRE